MGTSADDLRAGADTVAQIVRDLGPLTRGEVADQLRSRGRALGGDALATTIGYAELDASIASGPMRGKQQTYRALDLPASTKTEDELLAWVTRTYARGHGPFTAADLVWWTSPTLTQARRGIGLAGLQETTIAGHVLVTGGEPQAVTVPRALLVANFDEIISHARDATLREEVGPAYDQIMTATGLVLLDGRLAGPWSRTLHDDRVDVTVTLASAPDDRTRRSIASEAEAFGRFLGLHARLTIAP